jgi:hypothetical protein
MANSKYKVAFQRSKLNCIGGVKFDSNGKIVLEYYNPFNDSGHPFDGTLTSHVRTREYLELGMFKAEEDLPICQVTDPPYVLVIDSLGTGTSETNLSWSSGSSTKQFNAYVMQGDNPAQPVTWSVEGATASTTQISQSGLLTVKDDEISPQLTIKCTSKEDPTVVGIATVRLKPRVLVKWASPPPGYVQNTSTPLEARIWGGGANQTISYTIGNNNGSSVSNNAFKAGQNQTGDITIQGTNANAASSTVITVKPVVMTVTPDKTQYYAGDKIIFTVSTKCNGSTISNAVTFGSSGRNDSTTNISSGGTSTAPVGTLNIGVNETSNQITVTVQSTTYPDMPPKTVSLTKIAVTGVPPTIDEEPADVSIAANQSTILTVEALNGGVGTLSYQWYQSFMNSKSGWELEGETSASYETPNLAAGTYYFYVKVTNTVTGGTEAVPVSIWSEVATVTVT